MTQPPLIPTTNPTPPRSGNPLSWMEGRRNARTIRATRCRDCREPILRGIDEDVCAFLVDVDPAPLSTLGEVVALLQGRKTYELTRTATGAHILTRRNRWSIKGRPPGQRWIAGRGGDVVAEHRCRSSLPTIPTMLTPLTAQREDTIHECPF